MPPWCCTGRRTATPRCRLGRRVTLYVCGITPYDAAHVGHAFTYVAFDTLARFLRARGHEVVYCQNVTDVDDDVLRRAAANGEDYLALGGARRPPTCGSWTPSTWSGRTSSPRPPRRSRSCSSWPAASSTAATPTRSTGPCSSTSPAYPGFGELSGLDAATQQRPAGRAGRRPRRPAQAQPAGLHRLAAQPAGRAVVGQPLGAGPAGLAPGVLGHGPAPPRGHHRPARRRGRSPLPPS
jgi:L-cysteine:1D-myo-inositol 2-amino-2-deoxy-alpha-D-glucopyranoside ligase